MKTSRPICGIASLSLPLGIAAIEYVASRLAPEGNSGTLTWYVLAGYALVAAVAAGAILAIIALARREKWMALPLFSLLLNLIAIVLLLKWMI
jgi:hypothetical protein